MTLPSNAITPQVIREMMPPYHLNLDLLQATFAALPPPPSGASTAWRRAHLARMIEELSTLMPANAAQARMATQRETAACPGGLTPDTCPGHPPSGACPSGERTATPGLKRLNPAKAPALHSPAPARTREPSVFATLYARFGRAEPPS